MLQLCSLQREIDQYVKAAEYVKQQVRAANIMMDCYQNLDGCICWLSDGCLFYKSDLMLSLMRFTSPTLRVDTIVRSDSAEQAVVFQHRLLLGQMVSPGSNQCPR